MRLRPVAPWFKLAPVAGTNLTSSEEAWVQFGKAGVVRLLEQASSPASVANTGQIYVKQSDGLLYYMDENGNEVAISGETSVLGLYTVGAAGTGADYTTDGTADDVQINAALTAANADGGGLVYVLPGTYVIADIIQAPSNVKLVGAGIDVTIIQAQASYAGLGPTGGRSLLRQSGSSASNIDVRHITWDANGQNNSGLTSNSNHRAIDMYDVTNLRFEYCKVTNPINWATNFWDCHEIWVCHNVIDGGWDTTYNQQDGIHLVNCSNYHIKNNDVDTSGTGTSGDDAIAVQGYGTADGDMAFGEITGNLIASYTNGIKVVVGTNGNTSSADVTDLIISNNTIWTAGKGGIKLDNPVETTAKFRRVNISDNTIYNYGTRGAADADGIHLNAYTTAANVSVAFHDMVIVGNVIRKGAYTSGKGINIEGKGYGLVIANNTISELSGTTGIAVGGASNPIKDIVIANNRLSLADAASSVIGIDAYGTERCNIQNNEILGHQTGTTYGIRLQANATAGNDPEGVARIETSAYNTVSGNNIYNFDNGVAEVNTGANPGNNQFVNNIFNTVTTPHVVLATTTRVFSGSGSSFGTGTAVPEGGMMVMDARDPATDPNVADNFQFLARYNVSTDAKSAGIAFSVTSSLTNTGAAIWHVREGSNSFGSLYFGTKASGGSTTGKMRLSSTGGLLSMREVIADSDGRSVLATPAEHGAVFTNEGASAEANFVLPTAAANLTYTFVCQDNSGIKITASTGDTIQIGTSVSAAAGNAATTVIGSTVTLVAINATEWMAIAVTGDWIVT